MEHSEMFKKTIETRFYRRGTAPIVGYVIEDWGQSVDGLAQIDSIELIAQDVSKEPADPIDEFRIVCVVLNVSK